MISNEETAVQETQDTTPEQPVAEGLENQQPEPTGEPQRSANAQQVQQTQTQVPSADGSSPAWWKPDLFKLKYRGSEVSPKDYGHAVNLMQKGWSFEQAMSQLKREREEFDATRGKYSQYEKLDEAFAKNPAFKQKILDMYREHHDGGAQPQRSNAAVANAVAGDPAFQQILSEVGNIKKAVEQWQEEKADESVQVEMRELRGKHPTVNWDQITESGHTLMWDILNHAHSNKLPSLATAFRDYMFDTMTTNAKMQGAEQVAKQRQENARKGIVSTGSNKPVAPRPSTDVRQMSYDQISEMIKSELGVSK